MLSKKFNCCVCQKEFEGARATVTNKYVYCLKCYKDFGADLADTIILAPDEVWLPGAAVKHDDGKPDLSLIPRSALVAEAKAFMVGADRYGRYNYTDGLDLSRLMSALLRHAFAYIEGEDIDADGQHHLGSVRACAAMILETERLGTLRDNRNKAKGDTK